ncbi:hypothetical protein AtNW77_Chr5g0125231 [Arabidopsis thaliana]|uniref:Transmembrane protein n=2 Tax=Arabidopsis TaxID=3701 RepID=A0A178UA15_ARATH|nr:hypothetical protein ISN45_At05g037180 [Arabidopsis thaliana x Arabidopsis arenosa]OAO90808.1 hypothetical protein AXX17_AT5G40390 [Arabidopsis thaliana]VYS69052.1 unnamed protein product [Arabidopsis thaliana]
MTSSMVSSMALFLLLLLVFPHMDKALGAQEEAQKQRGIPRFRCSPRIPFCTNPNLPSPPPHRSFKGTLEPGH